ncbi:MAG: hypothetical protein PHR53_05625 [Bacteroidales bacterium]|nr:hypothetical protein [Bacteroidales bacterium]
MKHLFIIFFIIMAFSEMCFGQSEYENFVKQRKQEMTNYKNQADAEFTKYLQERWSEFQAFQAQEAPSKPKPKVAPVVPPKIVFDLPTIPDATENPEVDVPFEETVPIDLPFYTPSATIKNNFEEIKVDFYGLTLYFQIDKKMRFSLSNVQEESVAGAWEQLSKSDYVPLIESCQSIVGKNGANDWAFYCLTKKLAASFFAPEAFNEQSLFQMFLLSQAGYSVKIARGNDQLYLLMATEQPLYSIRYLMINNVNYYIVNAVQQKDGELFYTYKKDFASANHKLNLIIRQPLPATESVATAEFQAKGCQLSISVSTDQTLKDFYADFPQCDVILHAETTVSPVFEQQVISQFKKAVDGKKQQEAVSMILNFCQTAFDYMTDPEQFGYEKPFFPEELFFYPYSDCEDRSILFSYLVRNVLNMDVVLLDYPQHIATAVRFDDNSIQGDDVLVGDTRYIICDPTYINAAIGMEMPEFKSQKIQPIPIIIKDL